MRIAYICADVGVPVFGNKGCSIHVQEVLRAMSRHGAQVDLFAANSEGQPPDDFEAISVHPLPTLRRGPSPRREAAALAANRELRRALLRQGPFDLVYERYSLWSFAGMEYALNVGTPGLLEVNAPLVDEASQHRGLHYRRSAERIAERAFSASTVLIGVSEEIAGYLERRYQQVRGRIHVVSNGVDPRRFETHCRQASLEANGNFTVGFVGSLKPWHDLRTLVEAFVILLRHDPRVRLLVVGDGPEREALMGHLQSRPGLFDAVQLTGAVPPHEIPAHIASMDVAVAPYPKLESFYFSPLKVFEYMAAGAPVVASDIGQVRELIQNGVTGILYPPGNSGALAQTLLRLLGDPKLRSQLGSAARTLVVHAHTWDRRVRSILDLAGIATTV